MLSVSLSLVTFLTNLEGVPSSLRVWTLLCFSNQGGEEDECANL